MTDYNDEKYRMILTVVSKGYADIVIAAAKEEGARGGTVLFARGSGIHETEKFLNIPIEPEKEIVLTIVKTEAVKQIVSAITKKAGLTKSGRGITIVLPVTKVAGMSSDVVPALPEKENQ
ncbi:MAG: P-II family nitrogen regulator [Clostridiales Family XIII bacterium]|jgi:nitrogen regulatory protein PII|nr:P-II family nitrogen regulator [Clostridiales Family XIII bacterium]